MINYYKCEIISCEENFVEIECNNISYIFKIINNMDNSCDKVYIHEVISEYSNEVYAFETPFQRNTFRALLKIKGVGVKTITLLLKTYSYEEIKIIVKNKQIEKLLIIPGIGRITANNILGIVSEEYEINKIKEAKKILKSFGYTANDINKILHMIDKSDDIEIIVKKAIKKL